MLIATMPRPLPPLNALRAFEAAARHLSFARAATELNVTSAAVSHHVKTLEDYLGVSLFHRTGRGLKLTEPARKALPDIRDGFDHLARGTARLRGGAGAESLPVRVAPGFASRWLIPRLARFAERHPHVDARIDAQYDLPDFRAGEARLAVHFGPGEYPPDLRADRLLGVRVLPLCSPGYLQREGISLEQPADLARCRLLHDDTLALDASVPDWDAWLEEVGAGDVDTSRGAHFSHALLALEAAVDGQGVVLTYDLIAGPDLEAGRLVAPFDFSLPARSAYYAVCPKALATDPAVAAFRDWLLEETRGGDGAP